MRQKPHAGGRPAWFPPSTKFVEALAARGLTVREIALSLGISPRTFYYKQRQHSEILEAVRSGRAQVVLMAANVVWDIMHGFRRLPDGTVHEVNNPRLSLEAAKFVLRTRAGWGAMTPAQEETTLRESAEREAEEERTVSLTPEERKQLRDIIRRAKKRMDRAEVESYPQSAPDLETCSNPPDPTVPSRPLEKHIDTATFPATNKGICPRCGRFGPELGSEVSYDLDGIPTWHRNCRATTGSQ